MAGLVAVVVAVCGCSQTGDSPKPGATDDARSTPDGWVEFPDDPMTAGFSFNGPPNLRPIPMHGTDSLVLGYQCPDVEFTIDFGMYSEDVTRRSGSPPQQVTIDGRDAMMRMSDSGAALFIGEVYEGGHTRFGLSATIHSARGREIMEAVFASLDFHRAHDSAPARGDG